MPDKFEDLSTYLAILDAGGINAAAVRLGIAKSAVSRRLTDLERRLGASLVDRTNRRLEPTIVGLEYARRARVLLAALDELDASVKPGEAIESVTVLADQAVIAYKLVPALSRLGSIPGVPAIRMVDGGSAESPERADIHIAAIEQQDARVIFRTATVLCASPDYLRERAETERLGNVDRRIVIGIKGAVPVPTLELPDLNAVAVAAAAGLGLAMLPDYVVSSACYEGRLVRVPAARDPEYHDMFAWCSKDASPAARRLLDLLLSVVN
ncbi:MAG: LysR family transcriptional regulator [Sphingomonas phyllosphaerae]